MEITALFAAMLLPAIGIVALNAIFGLIAMDMAKKRGLKPAMAFFAAFFGSFVALFMIALIPVSGHGTEEKQ